LPDRRVTKIHWLTRNNAVGTRDTRIDAYIAKSADFARPILTHIRDVVHGACPDVEETMKWSFPHFQYKGMLCSMAAFKEHCSFGFWKGSLIVENASGEDEKGMGQFGRITKVSDLPSKTVLRGYIKKAMKLNEDGVKVPARTKPKTPKELDVPDDLARALQANKSARAVFEAFSPSAKREYVEWITDAKTDATRTRRLETAIEWIAEGKSRNWKYEKC
jgi:uncharacterized protein YdeI (YjbR/CyaY-like superfamily)